MSQGMIWPNLTPARRAWLERLEAQRVCDGRVKGRTGYDCMQLGWTQWVRGVKDGRYFGEALTDAGHRVLEEARAALSSRHADP